jgi:hypothetical protein
VADEHRSKFPKLAALMDETEPDVLAFMAFPVHRDTCTLRRCAS